MINHINNSLVSVIIPTMALHSRVQLLQRAVASIRTSSRQFVQIIVVVNGNKFDEKVCAWLKLQPDVHFEYCATPSLPAALLRGRELVHTEFFSTLDDDDEYLPDATDKKIQAMQAHPNADFLAGNYYRHSVEGIDSIGYSSLKEVPANPMKWLMHFNWLHNGSALYRSAAIGLEYFENIHPYAEWTWLAFRLSIDQKNILILDEPVFRYNLTAGSLSQSDAHFKSYIPLFNRMLAMSPPRSVARLIYKKMGAAYHDAADTALQKGLRKEAWRNHLQSLLKIGGLRYLGFTRHLLW